MRTPSSNSKLISGAAIMLALWALFLLSALVISWALDIDSRLSLSGDGARMLKAEAVACSGAEVALHPAVKPGSPNLSGELDNGATYQARLTGEGGRLNLNWLVAGEAPDRLERLRAGNAFLFSTGPDAPAWVLLAGEPEMRVVFAARPLSGGEPAHAPRTAR